MKGRKDKFKVSGMMILTVVLVFAVLAAVTLAFEMLQKRQEKRISAAKSTSQNEIIMNSQETEYQIESTIIEEDSERIEMVYLIKGDNKGSNKYARVDKLSYTESVRYTEEQLACLDTYGLRITRNEIYARHGRMFNDQEVQEYFTGQDWYVPLSAAGDFDESCLNEVEKYNAELIRAYELKQWN